jgi:hypothetical protein
MRRVDFELEEYRALRAEIIQSMDDGNKIIAFGLTAVGLVLAAGLSSKGSVLSVLILGFILPVLSTLVLSMWFAAQERIARASHFLSGVEVRIKSSFDDVASVSWEAWLRAPKATRKTGHFWSTEQSGIALFGLITVSAILIGCIAGGNGVDSRITASAIIASILICGTVFMDVLRRYGNWQRWLSTYYDPALWPPPA